MKLIDGQLRVDGRMTAPDAVAAVIFDCDGVLVDSEVLSADTLVAALGGFGFAVDRRHIFGHFTGHSFADVSAQIAKATGRQLPPGFEARYRAALLRRFKTELRIVPGITAVLDRLAVPWCVATGSSPARARRSLEIAGLWRRTGGRLVTASMVKRGKPAPDLFLRAAAMLNADPRRCLVVEDSDAGVAAGLAAGMTVWRFTGGSHFALGYGRAAAPIAPHRNFDSMALFFDPAPHLRRVSEANNAIGA